ncbi:MAG: SDR family oxidoreductase [Steroidobacteraceae bacterium]
MMQSTINKSLRAGLLAVLAAITSGCAGGGRAPDLPPLLLVAGATGGTGREVVTQALARGYRVRALVRDEAKAREQFGDSVQYAVGDVRNAGSLSGAMAGVSYVISAVGSNSRREPDNKPELVDYGGVKALAEAAREARVQQFVLVSSMGVTHEDHMLNRILDNIMIWKLRGENSLRDSGVDYTIVRPGGLNNEAGGKLGIRVLQSDPKDSVGQIPRADVAAVCVNALGNRSAINRTLAIVSDPTRGPADWASFFVGLKPDER